MSSSPTAPTSMTGSSSTCASPDEVAVIACGALAGHVRQVAPEAERMALDLLGRGYRVVLGYADCGSYGALDEVCARLGISRLPGLHCYDVLAGPEAIAAMLAREPGTYLLTDFLVRSFRASVLAPLGLEDH